VQEDSTMRANLLAAAAIGALFAGQAYAQTDQTGAAAGAMTQQDIEDLGQALEKAGFADFRPVTGGDVFRGMSADGTSAVIAVAPEMGNNTADGGTTGEAAGSGMTDAGMFQVTTEEGRTLYIVVRPETTGMSGSTTTGEAADTDAAGTETAAATGDGDTDNAGDNADKPPPRPTTMPTRRLPATRTPQRRPTTAQAPRPMQARLATAAR
jgi:hypothetical protein